MKAWLRLALAVLVLAGLVTIPNSAEGNGDLQCAQFCMVALCASPEVCGPHLDANGQPACGCHNPYGVVGS